MFNILCLFFILTTYPQDASAYGKYCEFLYRLEVAEDRDIYGDYYDWGFWSNSDYAGYSNLKPGYWVYYYPYWYVWSRTAEEIDLDPSASAYGKYQGLIHILHMPDDKKAFNDYYDWGFWEGYSYGDYNNLTPGYWVYSAPNWYVWADVINIKQGG